MYFQLLRCVGQFQFSTLYGTYTEHRKQYFPVYFFVIRKEIAVCCLLDNRGEI